MSDELLDLAEYPPAPDPATYAAALEDWQRWALGDSIDSLFREVTYPTLPPLPRAGSREWARRWAELSGLHRTLADEERAERLAMTATADRVFAWKPRAGGTGRRRARR